MRALLAVLGMVGLLVAEGTAAASGSGVAVEITDRLEPPAVTVPVGATVRWRNADDERHRVRSESGPEKFDSGNLEPAETWSETFALPGEYRYVDARNPDERAYWGSVTVTGRTDGESGSSQDGPPASGDAGSAASDVGGGLDAISMGDRSFAPDSVSVPVGTTVTWVNDSDRDHTVTADDGAFDSGELPPGARFSHTFDQTGTHGYFCAFHGGMRGTVVVGDAGAAQDTVDEEAGSPGDGGQTTAARSSAAGTAVAPDIGGTSGDLEVEVRDFAFDPEAVRVSAGSAVTWRHVGDAPHTVTADDDSFDSGMTNSGETFSHTFDEPGSFRYVCELHPQMVAEVIVGDAVDADPPGPVVADAGEEPSASTSAGKPEATVEGQTAAASPASPAEHVMPMAVFLAGLLVSASVLTGAWRVERALRASASPDAPPRAPRHPGRT